ncbi:hypothetical protein OAC98_00655 [Cyclobacteriaceae bacterium]|jgi:hypothetical protein|nr:hypothetical protein [Cyclobacteriaceae bacterium]
MWYRIYFLLIYVFSLNVSSSAQSELPYKEIPSYPANYTQGTVMSRMIDGLGYRYYWATENLRTSDLDFKPETLARSTFETMEHIYGLSFMILNASKNQVNERRDPVQMTAKDLRLATLYNLKSASEAMALVENLDELTILFEGSTGREALPFWHVLNGPLADAIYHTGQMVSFRRTSGNPMNPKVNVFMGKTDL